MNNHITELLNFFKKYVNNLINNNIVSNINIKNINIDYLSKSKKGHVSSNIFLILNKKILNKNFDLKSDITKKLDNLNFINSINITNNGFINIFFKKDYLIESLIKIIELNVNYGYSKFGDNKKINIEFVSANPTGPIHIAHIRGAVLGDVLSNILKSTGYKVTKEYYVNDAGSQIEILARSLFKRYCQSLNIKNELENDEYPGEYLVEIANKILSEDSNKWLNKDENERQKYFKKYAINFLINKIKQDLSLINIEFDKFTYESKIIEKNLIEDLFLKLNEKNLVYEGILEKPKGEDVKNWKPRKQLLFKSSKLLDNTDRAFKKANNEWTYFATDAAYHYDKFLRKYDQLINIWGSDHIGYIQRMRSIIFAITNDENYLNIVTCQIVRLIKKNEVLKMSKREGNYITLNEVYELVGKDPLRYFMISTKSETSIDFDLDKVIQKNKDNPVFYCQYAYARTCSVLSKFNNLNLNFDKNLLEQNNFFDFITDDEWEIILKILTYPYILHQISLNYEPHRITNYLEDLCSSFHSFWNKGKDNESFRFLDESNLDKTNAKILWLKSFKIVLKNAFDIIGIEAPEKM